MMKYECNVLLAADMTSKISRSIYLHSQLLCTWSVHLEEEWAIIWADGPYYQHQ